MGKNRFTWGYYLQLAIKSKIDSESFLSTSVKNLMKDKGFSDRVTSYFDASFASGDEVVITFNKEGEMADLDIIEASKLQKEQIIEHLSHFLSPDSIQLLLDEL